MPHSAENPLLVVSDLPNHAPPFDRIEESHYFPAIEAAITQARLNIETVRDNPEAPDFENTIVAMETAAEVLGYATGIFYNQLSVMETDGMQDLARKIGPVASDFGNDILFDPRLFARVRAVYEKRESLGLNAEQIMLLDESYKGFVRGGALLGEDKKARLREISARMSVLGPDFSSNVNKATEGFILVVENKSDLAGLPEGAIDGARHMAQEKGHPGKWVFTLDFPSYYPFMQFAENRALREKIWRAYTGRAWKDAQDNSDLILEIVRLRHERAQILGYPTHAHYVLEKRMAETPDTVFSFIDELKTAYRDAAKADLEALKDFAAQDGLSDLKPWDVAFYGEKLREKLYDFSSEDLRPYFPLGNVLNGMFTHFSKLFHLRFQENSAYPVWHPDTKAYDVYDLTSDEFVGTLYADFHPRKGKRGGAWKTGYREQGLYHGKIERPVVAIVCNFTRPTADRPSLLTFDEVQTLFHEMGHATHALLSRVTYQSLSGTNVLWDFVELPSQLQENWCYARETLDLFAAHYQTGEKIPEDLHRKLCESRNFMAGWAGLRQMGMSQLDMLWHTQDPAQISDVAAFEDAAMADVSLFPRLSGPVSTTFQHLFAGGYSAGYYSYKWAEVLDADAFELFMERGLYDPPTAESFKNEVLSKGGSEHPRILYRRFRGRDADPQALLRREGLCKKAGM
ncbi:MAG: M3 family metallopeptidase [Rhodospirillales bacterium]|nr:M3 family metallopeptidase [Rhodospirillales bacterium]